MSAEALERRHGSGLGGAQQLAESPPQDLQQFVLHEGILAQGMEAFGPRSKHSTKGA